MPELGKATYTLIFDTRQGEVAVAGIEARASAAGKSIQASMGNAERSFSTMGATAQGAAGEVDTAAGTMTASMEGAGAAGMQMGEEISAGSAMAGSAAQAGAAKTVTAWDAAGKRMKSIGGRMKSIGHGMTHKITLPVALIGGLAVKQALNYQEQIKMIQTQAGGTAQEVEYMNKAILRLAGSGKVTQTPVDLAKALYHLESVGVRGRAALDALTSSAHLATIGHASLEESTNALIGAITTGIPGVKSFDQAVGVMNATIGAGNLRMDEFNAAMTTGVLKQAALNGVTLQELGASLAEFTSQRLPAVQSMTALRMSLTQMLKPTSQQITAMHLLGMAEGKYAKNGLQIAYMIRTQGLVPTIQLIHDRYDALVKKFGKEEATKVLLSAFGGAKSSKAMLALVTGSEDLRKKYVQVSQASMNFAELTAVAMNEPLNKMKANLAQMSASLIGIGNTLVPIVAKLVAGIGRLFHWFDKLSPKTQKWVLIAIGLAAVLGPIIGMLGSLVILIGGIVAVGSTFAIVVGSIFAVAAALVYLAIRYKRVRQIIRALVHDIKWWIVWAHRHKNVARGLAVVIGILAFRMFRIRAAGFAARIGMTAMLGPMGLLVVAALAVAAAFLYMQSRIEAAQAAADEAISRVGTNRAQGLTFYATRVKKYEAAGMKPEAARKRARRETIKRYGEGSLPGAGGGAAAPPKPKAKDGKLPGYNAGADPRLGGTGKGTWTMPGSLDPVKKKKPKPGGKVSYGVLGIEWMHLQDAYLRAQVTKTPKDDIKALNAEKRWLDKTLKKPGLSERKRHEALQQLVMVNNALKRLNKTATDQKMISAKAAMELATIRGSFFDQFASNIFHRTENGKLALGSTRTSVRHAHVEQHNVYHEIPKDRYHHARRMREAMRGATE